MNDTRTPLQKLEDAFFEYLRDTDGLNDGEFPTGWVLAWQKGIIQNDDRYLPFQTSSDFTASPSASEELILGLLQITGIKVAQMVIEASKDDE